MDQVSNFIIMKQKYKKAVKIILGIEKAKRNITVLDDDIYITSFPRSGNTWVRFLIANMIWCDNSTNFINIEKRIPDIYKFTDSRLLSLQRPRYLKSHEYFDPRYPKVLYIVRDVRSIVVSYYHYLIRNGEISQKTSCNEFTKMFVIDGINYFGFGTWEENVLSWIRVRGNNPEKFCLIRYEDLKADGINTLRTIKSFLGLNCDDSQIQHAFNMSLFDRMKQMEKNAGKDWEETKYVKNTGIGFIRAGKENEWEEVLDKESIDIIIDNYSYLLSELGYEV